MKKSNRQQKLQENVMKQQIHKERKHNMVHACHTAVWHREAVNLACLGKSDAVFALINLFSGNFRNFEIAIFSISVRIFTKIDLLEPT